MKRCPSCHHFFDDSLNVCPTDGTWLETFGAGSDQQSSSATEDNRSRNDYHRTDIPPVNNASAAERAPTYIFEQRNGSHVTLNGAIAESNTQQYYQSSGTKLFRALFSGEPYQLSHTTFITILRVQEHVRTGYPEQARDVILYGDTRNIFGTGNDVTIEAVQHGNRLVARSIYIHDIDRNVSISPNIPAWLIRAIALVVLYLIICLVHGIITVDYRALASALLPVIVTFALSIYLLIRLIRGR